MTSKVLVKLPVVPFSQKGSSCDADVLQRSKKPPAAASNSGNNAASSELSATGEAESSDARPHEHSHEDKVAQLEQNVKFLQEQHQTMLVALHKEIDQLRQRNRELQFQLVFSSKGPKISPCGISSPEDATTVPSCSNKLKESPTNIMPLQIELLEKDVQELRVCLDEEKKLNASLSATIDKQQQELAAAAPTERATAASSDKAIQVDTTMECQQVEMQARLVDAEALVKRLRQENVEQRKELGQLKQQVSSSSTTSSSSSSSSSSRNGRSAATHRVPAPPSSSYYNPSSAAPIAALAIDPQQPQLSDEQQHQQTFPKFPPLQTQSYWHRASRTNHGGYDSGPQLHNYQRNARHHNHHHQSHHQHQPAQQHQQHQQQQQQQYQQHHHQQLNQESRHQHHHNRHQAPVQQQQQLKDGQAKPPGSSSSSSSSAASSSLLPQLRNGSVRVDTSGSSYPPFFRARSSHGHSYYKDNNCDQPQPQQPQQSRSGNNRKYRGPKPPRRENGHHPQDGGGTPRDYTGNQQQQHHNRDNQRQPRKPRS